MKLLSLLVLLCIPAAVAAQERPKLFSPERAGIDFLAGYLMNYEADQGTADTPTFPKEFSVGVEGKWAMTPQLTLVVAPQYGVDTKVLRTFAFVRMNGWSGKPRGN